MAITLLLYVDYIVLLAMIHDDPNKKLRIIQYYNSNMGMTINIDKTKLKIIKSRKTTFDTFIYDNKSWRKFLHTNLLEISITSS